jgi:ADP-ribose pyrophosphatase YjhB (NUDIX family)
MFPVSVKGIIALEDGILLLKNERDEWELPGGRLEHGETPIQCLEREIFEELNVKIYVETIVSCWVYPVQPDKEVVIITYRCQLSSSQNLISISDEHMDFGIFAENAIHDLKMPTGYKDSIALACATH